MASQRRSASQRQLNASQGEDDLSSADRKALVTETVMYLLSQEASKVPTKKSLIVKFVLRRHGRRFCVVILEAKEVLLRVFGYRLIDHDNKYFLVNKFQPSELGMRILRAPKEHHTRCNLLVLVLSLIFMKGGFAKEDEVWDFLKKLKIKVGDVPDSTFGDVKKVVSKDFVNMMYLQHIRRDEMDPSVYQFTSGVRAEMEITRQTLLNFVCKVYGNTQKSWPVQTRQIALIEGNEPVHLAQLLGKRMRLSEPSASQPRISASSDLQCSPSPSPSPSPSASSSSQRRRGRPRRGSSRK